MGHLVRTLRGEKIAEGAPTKKNLPLSEVVGRYYADVSVGLRPTTLRIYRDATSAMVDWAISKGIATGDDLRGEPRAAACGGLHWQMRCTRQPFPAV